MDELYNEYLVSVRSPILWLLSLLYCKFYVFEAVSTFCYTPTLFSRCYVSLKSNQNTFSPTFCYSYINNPRRHEKISFPTHPLLLSLAADLELWLDFCGWLVRTDDVNNTQSLKVVKQQIPLLSNCLKPLYLASLRCATEFNAKCKTGRLCTTTFVFGKPILG